MKGNHVKKNKPAAHFLPKPLKGKPALILFHFLQFTIKSQVMLEIDSTMYSLFESLHSPSERLHLKAAGHLRDREDQYHLKMGKTAHCKESHSGSFITSIQRAFRVQTGFTYSMYYGCMILKKYLIATILTDIETAIRFVKLEGMIIFTSLFSFLGKT